MKLQRQTPTTNSPTPHDTVLRLLQRDPWLRPYASVIEQRHAYAKHRRARIIRGQHRTLPEAADAHLRYGLHLNEQGWTAREWAPNATQMFLVGDFTDWQERPEYAFHRVGEHGEDWLLCVPREAICHGQHYKLHVYWHGGHGERIPALARRVVQDQTTHLFAAQVWQPECAYTWQCTDFTPQRDPLYIYECHIGMAQDAERVGTYDEFRLHVLPRVKAAGYNCLQIMAIQEHPYYGSFGYHVSSFFAPTSRCGTPEQLKALIDAAHGMGISVIMDLVVSHAAINEAEGLGLIAGDPTQYFCPEPRRQHPAWGSLCFDYGKDRVIHFLLSCMRYWLEEFHFDGFRFDGVTSMLYTDHGIGTTFTSYDDYYNGRQDEAAISFLTLANALIHELRPSAITIAEEVSGMPGVAAPIADGGMGFDYRLAMNIPDYWIKTIKEQRDEDWSVSHMLYELTNRRADERSISYAESHDQALVGDKTIIFRLIDADMYWHFRKGDENARVHRGIALHKMIRLITASTGGGGYLCFMGNEFGHPEWIDFPRQGNGWSHKYARRQWHLLDDDTLCYHYLADFDRDMLRTLSLCPAFGTLPLTTITANDADQVVAFLRGSLLFVFNFSPVKSYTDYGLRVPHGDYRVLLNTDAPRYGGHGFADDTIPHFTTPLTTDAADDTSCGLLRLYLPARTAVVMQAKHTDRA